MTYAFERNEAAWQADELPDIWRAIKSVAVAIDGDPETEKRGLMTILSTVPEPSSPDRNYPAHAIRALAESLLKNRCAI